jgi:hypothetical protein
MRKLAILLVAPALFACGGATNHSAFDGTWTCSLDTGVAHKLIGTISTNSDGSLTVTGGLAPGYCTTTGVACEWPVSGLVATAPPATLSSGPTSKFDSETLTLSGDSLIIDEYITYSDDNVPVHVGATCTKS